MRRGRTGGWVAAVVGLGLLSSPAVWAQDPIHKVGRGVVNVLTSWLEVLKQIHLGSQEAHAIKGIGSGIVKGVGLTVLRIGVGAYEALTFPLPYPKGYASPYEPMELPDYAWE